MEYEKNLTLLDPKWIHGKFFIQFSPRYTSGNTTQKSSTSLPATTKCNTTNEEEGPKQVTTTTKVITKSATSTSSQINVPSPSLVIVTTKSASKKDNNSHLQKNHTNDSARHGEAYKIDVHEKSKKKNSSNQDVEDDKEKMKQVSFGKCFYLEHTERGKNSSSSVSIQNFTGNQNQQWLFENGGFIRNVHTGKVLTVISIKNPQVIACEQNHALNQKWSWDGEYLLTNLNIQMALDVQTGSNRIKNGQEVVVKKKLTSEASAQLDTTSKNNLTSKAIMIPVTQQFEQHKASDMLIQIFSDKNNIKVYNILQYISMYSDKSHRGILQYLCNKLYEVEDFNEVEFYLPQMLNIYLNKVEEDSYLECFLLDRCAKSVHFGILLSWLLDAELGQNGMQPEICEKATRLRETVETVTINRELPHRFLHVKKNMKKLQFSSLTVNKCDSVDAVNNTSPTTNATTAENTSDSEHNVKNRRCVDTENTGDHMSSDSKSSAESIEKLTTSSSTEIKDFNFDEIDFSWSAAKIRRLNYYNDEMHFIQFLTNLSLRLMSYPVGAVRNEKLRADLEQHNCSIPAGVYAPICKSSDEHCRLVRFVASECIALSTKERVPCMIYAEVIRDEFTHSDPQFYQNSGYLIFSSQNNHHKSNHVSFTAGNHASSHTAGNYAGNDMKRHGRTKSLPTEDFGSLDENINAADEFSSSLENIQLGSSSFEANTNMEHNLNEHESLSTYSGNNSPAISSHNEETSDLREIQTTKNIELGECDENVQQFTNNECSSQQEPIFGSYENKSMDQQMEFIERKDNNTKIKNHDSIGDHIMKSNKENVPNEGLSTSVKPGNIEDDYEIIELEKEEEADRQALMYAVYGESWEEKKKRIRSTSPYGIHPKWNLKSFIVKSNDDLRQELMAMQLISMFQIIFQEEKLPIYLRPYSIIPTSADCGILETVTDTVSLSGLKKKFPNYVSLLDFFKKVYGVETSKTFRTAQQNFVESLAGYSVVSYLLQIKDRHNANLLIDREGHIIHIDFGFFLSNSPGSFNFESAPFKLTAEFVELMEAGDTHMMNHFRMLVYLGFKSSVKHMERIISIVKMMLPGLNFPCFLGDSLQVLKDFRERFHSHLNELEFSKFVRQLVDESMDNWRTRQYDNFQRITNNIL